MRIKLLAEEGTGRLLGAQIVGEDGVDKRTDVFATAIAGKMTVFDLESLDLAYAPPFGSANDPSTQPDLLAIILCAAMWRPSPLRIGSRTANSCSMCANTPKWPNLVFFQRHAYSAG